MRAVEQGITILQQAGLSNGKASLPAYPVNGAKALREALTALMHAAGALGLGFNTALISSKADFDASRKGGRAKAVNAAWEESVQSLLASDCRSPEACALYQGKAQYLVENPEEITVATSSVVSLIRDEEGHVTGAWVEAAVFVAGDFTGAATNAKRPKCGTCGTRPRDAGLSVCAPCAKGLYGREQSPAG